MPGSSLNVKSLPVCPILLYNVFVAIDTNGYGMLISPSLQADTDDMPFDILAITIFPVCQK